MSDAENDPREWSRAELELFVLSTIRDWLADAHREDAETWSR